MVVIARTITEVKKIFPDAVSIWEEENKFWVELPNKAVTIVLKPRKKEAIRDILIENLFPRKAVEVVLNGVKNTEAINKIKDKTSVILEGPAGVGKTVACVWRIAKMMQIYKINNPLYVSAVLYNKEVFERFREHDAFLLDDINTELHETTLSMIQAIIYYAESQYCPIFITTNNRKVFHQFAEPILSRLSHCDFIRVDGEDLRVKSLLEKKQQAEIKK